MPLSTSLRVVNVICTCAVVLAALAAIGMNAGCNIVGPAGFLIAGEEKVEAKFLLPVDRPAVVFVDDRSSRLPSRSLRDRVSQAAERTLLDGGAAAKSDIISSESIGSILAGERSTRQSGIVEVGTAVGAQVVVYATIDSFTLSPDGAQLAPTAVARVKVMDVSSKGRLWPSAPDEWFTVSATTKPASPEQTSSQAERTKYESELADRLGLLIGRLFIKHERHEANPRVGN